MISSQHYHIAQKPPADLGLMEITGKKVQQQYFKDDLPKRRSF